MALNPPAVSNVNATSDNSFRIADTSGIASTNTVALQTASGVLKVLNSDGSSLVKLQVANPTTNDDVATKSYVDAAAGITSCEQVLTMTLAFGTAGTQTSTFLLPTGTYVTKVQVQVGPTPFNGTAPTLSVGYTGQLTKFMTTADNNLKVAGLYTKEQFSQMAHGSPAGVILTYVADSSSAGDANIRVWFVQAPKTGQA